MAVATAPTVTSIVTEAWKKAGIPSPSVAQLDRARNEWMQEILNDIWMRSTASGNTQLKTLQTTAIAIGVDNQRQYALPTDFNEELEITLLDGETTGTAQAGTGTTVTLAAAEGMTQLNAEGKYVLMTGGTSKRQYRQIISYNSTTKVATVDRAWDTSKTPVSGDTYLIVDKEHEVDEIGPDELNDWVQPQTPGLPKYFAKFADQFYFDRPLDKGTYGMLLRYYANIHQIDLAEGSTTLITKIYTNWQGVLKLGIQMKAEESLKASEYTTTLQRYDLSVANLLMKEIPFGGEFEGFIL